MSDVVSEKRVPRRVRRLLDQLIATRQLSKTGLEWLVAATDPFHDSEIHLEGYPDVSSSRSITQCVTKTGSFTLSTGDDMHGFMLPCSPTINTGNLPLSGPISNYNLGNAGTISPGAGTAPIFSGLNLIKDTSNVDWRTSASAAMAGNILKLPLEFCAGQHRLIACGWEVVNTTPVINIGGSLTCYRSPNTLTNMHIALDKPDPPMNTKEDKRKSASHVTSTIASYEFAPTVCGSLPPGTQSQAVLYPNSQTWAASEGLYQCAVLNDTENRYINPCPGHVSFLEPPSYTALSTDGAKVFYTVQDSETTAAAWSTCSHHYPYDLSGFVISNNSGFTQQFQVTVKYFIEKIPTISDSNLLVLAKTPACYDPLALEIYSRAMAMLPSGVPVKMNPLGEWFENVMNAVSSFLPTLGLALGGFVPGGEIIGAGLGQVARSASEWNRNEREKESRKNMKQDQAVILAPNANGGVSAVVPGGGYKRKKLPPLKAKRN